MTIEEAFKIVFPVAMKCGVSADELRAILKELDNPYSDISRELFRKSLMEKNLIKAASKKEISRD